MSTRSDNNGKSPTQQDEMELDEVPPNQATTRSPTNEANDNQVTSTQQPQPQERAGGERPAPERPPTTERTQPTQVTTPEQSKNDNDFIPPAELNTAIQDILKNATQARRFSISLKANTRLPPRRIEDITAELIIHLARLRSPPEIRVTRAGWIITMPDEHMYHNIIGQGKWIVNNTHLQAFPFPSATQISHQLLVFSTPFDPQTGAHLPAEVLHPMAAALGKVTRIEKERTTPAANLPRTFTGQYLIYYYGDPSTPTIPQTLRFENAVAYVQARHGRWNICHACLATEPSCKCQLGFKRQPQHPGQKRNRSGSLRNTGPLNDSADQGNAPRHHSENPPVRRTRCMYKYTGAPTLDTITPAFHFVYIL